MINQTLTLSRISWLALGISLAFGVAVPLAAQPEPSELAARAPASSLTRANIATLERFLAVPAGKTAISASDRSLPRRAQPGLDRLLMWNEIALDTTAIDHTPVDPASGDDPLRFGQHFGPVQASRAMAIIHIAMFDAVNTLDGRFHNYDALVAPHGQVSVDRAIAQAAHDTLVWLYPHQQARLDALLAQDITIIPGSNAALAKGAALGAAAAAAIIARRTNDGSELPEQNVGTGPDDYHVNPAAGSWSPDPVSGFQSHWARAGHR